MEPLVFDVRNDPDHLMRLSIDGERGLQRLALFRDSAGQSLVHNYNPWPIRVIRRPEVSSLQQRNAQGAEVTRARDACESSVSRSGGILLTWNSNIPDHIPVKGQVVYNRCRLNTGKHGDPLDDFVKKTSQLWTQGMASAGVAPLRENMLRPESRLDVEKTPQAADQEAGSDQ